MSASVTPDEVKRLSRPTEANTFGIDFVAFTISDYETKKTIFEVGRDIRTPPDVTMDFSTIGEDMYRKIKYGFSEDVMRLPYIQTSLTFAVGPKELKGFRMIERHYFRDNLIKSYDFEFGFCIPSSVNTWDAVYSLPALSEKLITEMIDNPYETKSDSFYFVDGKLIMHNKASYKYLREDIAQSKKSYENKFQSKGSKATKPFDSGSKGMGGGMGAGGGGGQAALHMDVKTVDPSAADSKGSCPKGASAKAAKEQAWSKDSDYF